MFKLTHSGTHQILILCSEYFGREMNNELAPLEFPEDRERVQLC